MRAIVLSYTGNDIPDYIKSAEEEEQKESTPTINIINAEKSNLNIGDNNKIQNGKKGLVGEIVDKATEHFLGD